MKEIFEQFLRDNGAHDQFFTYIRKSYDRLLYDDPPEQWINAGLTWRTTRGGQRYWQKLHDEWFARCKRKDIHQEEQLKIINSI